MSTETIEPAVLAPPADQALTEVAELPPPPLPAASHQACANCGTSLTGRYCHECGQTGHVHRSMTHILEEAAHGVLHFDAKSWRTLPLLVARPGLLTRRYIEGQRVKYVSPLALFLFSVFVMFFANSLLDEAAPVTDAQRTEQQQRDRAELAKTLDETRAILAQRNTELAGALTPEQRESAAASLDRARRNVDQVSGRLEKFDARAKQPASGEPAKTVDVQLESDKSLLRRLYQHYRENPQLTKYKMKSASSKFAFLLVPLSLPFLWLMFFWRRDVRLYDHAIYALYSLSFMSLWFVVIRLAGLTPVSSRVVSLLTFYPVIHVFLHLKEAYRLGWGGALWRTFMLLIASAMVLIIFGAAVLFIALY